MMGGTRSRHRATRGEGDMETSVRVGEERRERGKEGRKKERKEREGERGREREKDRM